MTDFREQNDPALFPEPQGPLEQALPLAQTLEQPIPALRELQAQLVNLGQDDAGPAGANGDEARTVVVLDDPEGLAPKPAALSTWAYALASLFDGRRNAHSVCEAFQARYGQSIDAQQALQLQHELNTALLLNSTHFERTAKRQITSYLRAPVREPAHVSTAYPADPDELLARVRSFFLPPDGPGDLAALPPEKIAAKDSVRALIVPHIDLRVGGATYAHAYYELLRHSQAELFVILGVAHQNSGDGLFSVALKDFQTPLGLVPTDRSIAQRLQNASDTSAHLAELAHRTEHSVEFQAVMLKAVFAAERRRDFQIVPVLCGSIENYLDEDRNLLHQTQFIGFVAALRAELQASGRKWCILCSVDLSHVGPEFGHSTFMGPRMLPPVARADRKLLKCIENRDAAAMYQEIMRTQNSRHVDAVTAVLTMLQTCQGQLKRARLLHYDQMLKDRTHSAVTYASMVFEG